MDIFGRHDQNDRRCLFGKSLTIAIFGVNLDTNKVLVYNYIDSVRKFFVCGKHFISQNHSKRSEKERIMLKRKFLGNLSISHHKNTANLSPVKMELPKEVLLPMDQHIGAPAIPVVKVGDEVRVGQLVAEANGAVSAPIYSSVSGKVIKIEDNLSANGKTVPAIRIESDGAMTVVDGLTPPTVTDVDSLLDACRKSGIVGLGGAGFPTAVKLAVLKKGCIHTVIINGAECEPYITSDARTMLDDTEYVYEGIKLFQKVAPEIKKYVLAIEKNKPECIEALGNLTKDDEAVSIAKLPLLYPQGAEKIMIYNTLGITVPEGKLPADVGVVVINVSTLANLAKYVKTGMPLIEKYVTVDGNAIAKPQNVIVPIGTPVADVLEFVGGLTDTNCKVIKGGPMTGHALRSLSEPIVKTTNAIVALTEKETLGKKMTACIHCGKCVEVCPNSLNPTAFVKALKAETVDEQMAMLENAHVNLCMDCGCCAYVCPAARPLAEQIRIAKNSLREYQAHKASLK